MEQNWGELFEPALILLIVILNAIMGVYQEGKAEKALDALKNLSAPHARVIRDGEEKIIEAAELVPGDIILLEAGDAVPADGRIIESASMKLEEAALIDGCNRVQAMFKILLPVAAPGIVTTLIFIFINAWNEYTVALCLISTDTIKPMTVGINIFNGYNIIEWQYLFAASIFAIVPVVILFMSIEKNLTSGLTAGGVKG